jgi:hypothetical protein
MHRPLRILIALALGVTLLAVAQSPVGAAESCEPGFFSSTGEVPCMPAPPGTFVDSAGATLATPCPVGTYQEFSAAISCTVAEEGTYVPEPGLRLPIACPEDTFSDVTGAISCQPCPAGTSTNGLIGQSECQPIAPSLPTALGDCKKGGWVSYGIFKNQGDCVSFVATEGRNQGALA